MTEEEKERNKVRVKEAKVELLKLLEINVIKPTSTGGQQCGMPVYPISVKSEELGIEIIVSTHRSNHKNRELATLLMELAMDDLIK